MPDDNQNLPPIDDGEITEHTIKIKFDIEDIEKVFQDINNKFKAHSKVNVPLGHDPADVDTIVGDIKSKIESGDKTKIPLGYDSDNVDTVISDISSKIKESEAKIVVGLDETSTEAFIDSIHASVKGVAIQLGIRLDTDALKQDVSDIKNQIEKGDPTTFKSKMQVDGMVDLKTSLDEVRQSLETLGQTIINSGTAMENYNKKRKGSPEFKNDTIEETDTVQNLIDALGDLTNISGYQLELESGNAEKITDAITNIIEQIKGEQPTFDLSQIEQQIKDLSDAAEQPIILGFDSEQALTGTTELEKAVQIVNSSFGNFSQTSLESLQNLVSAIKEVGGVLDVTFDENNVKDWSKNLQQANRALEILQVAGDLGANEMLGIKEAMEEVYKSIGKKNIDVIINSDGTIRQFESLMSEMETEVGNLASSIGQSPLFRSPPIIDFAVSDGPVLEANYLLDQLHRTFMSAKDGLETPIVLDADSDKAARQIFNLNHLTQELQKDIKMELPADLNFADLASDSIQTQAAWSSLQGTLENSADLLQAMRNRLNQIYKVTGQIDKTADGLSARQLIGEMRSMTKYSDQFNTALKGSEQHMGNIESAQKMIEREGVGILLSSEGIETAWKGVSSRLSLVFPQLSKIAKGITAAAVAMAKLSDRTKDARRSMMSVDRITGRVVDKLTGSPEEAQAYFMGISKETLNASNNISAIARTLAESKDDIKEFQGALARTGGLNLARGGRREPGGAAARPVTMGTKEGADYIKQLRLFSLGTTLGAESISNLTQLMDGQGKSVEDMGKEFYKMQKIASRIGFPLNVLAESAANITQEFAMLGANLGGTTLTLNGLIQWGSKYAKSVQDQIKIAEGFIRSSKGMDVSQRLFAVGMLDITEEGRSAMNAFAKDAIAAGIMTQEEYDTDPIGAVAAAMRKAGPDMAAPLIAAMYKSAEEIRPGSALADESFITGIMDAVGAQGPEMRTAIIDALQKGDMAGLTEALNKTQKEQKKEDEKAKEEKKAGITPLIDQETRNWMQSIIDSRKATQGWTDRIGQAVEQIWDSISGRFSPIIERAGQSLASFAGKLADWAVANPVATTVAGGTAGAVGAGVGLYGSAKFFAMLKGTLSTITGASAASGAAGAGTASAAGAASAGGTAAASGGIISSIIGGAKALIGGISAKLIALVLLVVGAIVGLFEGISKSGLGQTMSETFGIISGIGSTSLKSIKGIGSAILGFGKVVLSVITGVGRMFFSIGKILYNVGRGIGKLVGAVLGPILDMILTSFNSFLKLLGNFFKVFEGGEAESVTDGAQKASGIADTAVGMITGFFDHIVQFFEYINQVVNGIVEKIDWLTKKINKARSYLPTWAGGLDDTEVEMTKINKQMKEMGGVDKTKLKDFSNLTGWDLPGFGETNKQSRENIENVIAGKRVDQAADTTQYKELDKLFTILTSKSIKEKPETVKTELVGKILEQSGVKASSSNIEYYQKTAQQWMAAKTQKENVEKTTGITKITPKEEVKQENVIPQKQEKSLWDKWFGGTEQKAKKDIIADKDEAVKLNIPKVPQIDTPGNTELIKESKNQTVILQEQTGLQKSQLNAIKQQQQVIEKTTSLVATKPEQKRISDADVKIVVEDYKKEMKEYRQQTETDGSMAQTQRMPGKDAIVGKNEEIAPKTISLQQRAGKNVRTRLLGGLTGEALQEYGPELQAKDTYKDMLSKTTGRKVQVDPKAFQQLSSEQQKITMRKMQAINRMYMPEETKEAIVGRQQGQIEIFTGKEPMKRFGIRGRPKQIYDHEDTRSRGVDLRLRDREFGIPGDRDRNISLGNLNMNEWVSHKAAMMDKVPTKTPLSGLMAGNMLAKMPGGLAAGNRDKLEQLQASKQEGFEVSVNVNNDFKVDFELNPEKAMEYAEQVGQEVSEQVTKDVYEQFESIFEEAKRRENSGGYTK